MTAELIIIRLYLQYGEVNVCFGFALPEPLSFRCHHFLLSLYSAFALSSVSHFIVPHSLRHTNNNYFLSAYQHIWLQIMNTDYGSLLSMLTVIFSCANVATV